MELWQSEREFASHARSRCAVVGIAALAVLWSIMDRAMSVRRTGAICTGVMHNFGDLPFHLAVVSRFVAEQQLAARAPLVCRACRSPTRFLPIFSARLLVTAGADLRTAIVLPAILGALRVGVVAPSVDTRPDERRTCCSVRRADPDVGGWRTWAGGSSCRKPGRRRGACRALLSRAASRLHDSRERLCDSAT